MTYEKKKRKLQRNINEKYGECIDKDWLISELQKAWAALEFYADDSNWIEANGDKVFDQFVSCDLGKRAREALNE